MGKLPFVVEPRTKPVVIKVGSEESGQIEIERRGYLTSGEKAFFQQVKQSDQGTSRLIGLSRKVSRIHGVEMPKAYEAIIRVLSGSIKEEIDKKIEEEFAEDMAIVIQELANGQASDELLMSACLLRYRINPEISMEEVMSLHPDIIGDLARLYRDEDNKVMERLASDDADDTGALEKVAKKSSPRTVAKT